MKILPKSSDIFCCELCDYSASRKSQYERHLTTNKHINRTPLNTFASESSYKFACNLCNKKYKARNSLWYHQQKCNAINSSDDDNNDNNDKP